MKFETLFQNMKALQFGHRDHHTVSKEVFRFRRH